MRTEEQIEKIKQTFSDPVQLWNVVSEDRREQLLRYYWRNPNVIKKTTGPSVLEVQEEQISDILDALRRTFGNFKLRNAHFFDVKKPHIIHNDDSFDYPQCYKAFVMPLWTDISPSDKAKFFVFDQHYFAGPAKFVNGEDTTGKPVHYNKFVTEYSEVQNKSDKGIPPYFAHLMAHIKDEWLEGLTVNAYFPWTVGSIIAFDSLSLHCASDFTRQGIKRKIGLSIFTEL